MWEMPPATETLRISHDGWVSVEIAPHTRLAYPYVSVQDEVGRRVVEFVDRHDPRRISCVDFIAQSAPRIVFAGKVSAGTDRANNDALQGV